LRRGLGVAELHSAVAWLHAYGRRYPHAWNTYARLLNALPHDWPAWCWCPSRVTAAALTGGRMRKLDPAETADVGPLGALAAWRCTQGIYRVHPTLLAELLATPITGDLPGSVLTRLPEWCVYVETPGHRAWELPLRGYWAHLEHENDAPPRLRLILDVEGRAELLQLVIHIGGTLEQGLLASFREARINARGKTIDPRALDDAQAEGILESVGGLVSVLLYLCAEEAEISDLEPYPPRVVRGAKRPLLPSPHQAALHECGYRIGARLDAARHEGVESEARGERALTAHVRRAHWHSFWSGPRDGERRLALRWLSPILVGGSIDTAVVRPVGGEGTSE
jgi:hypothetical protein